MKNKYLYWIKFYTFSLIILSLVLVVLIYHSFSEIIIRTDSSIDLNKANGLIKVHYWHENIIVDGDSVKAHINLDLNITKNNNKKYLPKIIFRLPQTANKFYIKNLTVGSVSNCSNGTCVITIPIENSSKFDGNQFNLVIDYQLSNTQIPKFMIADRVFMTNIGCTGYNNKKENCPNSDKVDKKVLFLGNVALRSSHGKDGINLYGGNLLGIAWSNFNSTIENRYDEKVVYYIDLNAQRRFYLISIVTSAIIGVLLGAIYNYLYYKKSIEENKRDLDDSYSKMIKHNEAKISNLKEMTKGKLNTDNFNNKYKSLNDKLDKLGNLIKSKKSKKQ